MSDGFRQHHPTPTEICHLVDEMVMGAVQDAEIANGLIAVEIWCKHLRELLRDEGFYAARAAVVNNRAAEDEGGRE